MYDQYVKTAGNLYHVFFTGTVQTDAQGVYCDDLDIREVYEIVDDGDEKEIKIIDDKLYIELETLATESLVDFYHQDRQGDDVNWSA